MKSPNKYFTSLDTDQVTIDLPASAGTPAEIDITTKETSVSLDIYVASDFYWTFAANATLGASRLSSDTTRCKWPSGFYNFECSANHTGNIYIKSQAVGATIDGISYTRSLGS